MALKKVEQINTMTDEQIVQELKEKALPVYGTKTTKRNMLKKAYNLPLDDKKDAGKKNTRAAIQK